MGYKYETGVSLGGSWSRFYKIGGKFEDSFPYAKYHTSWGWLMPVVEKIESLGYLVVIEGNICTVKGYLGDYDFIEITSGTKFSAVYNAVVDFIEFYKEKNHHGKE